MLARVLCRGMHSSELERVLDLEQRGGDEFFGPAMNTDVFNRMFGGHLVAQALVAATRTVDPAKRVHSLHSYFVSAALADAATTYRVRRLRDGRSYASRLVEAFQDGQLCYIMTASFHHGEDTGPEHAEALPQVPAAEDTPVPDRLPTGVPGAEKDFAEWDIRPVEPAADDRAPATVSGRSLWFRFGKTLPDDDALHACALAYMSDMTLLYSSMEAHPDSPVQLASLDHALWFFRPVRVGDWLLYRQASPNAGAGRALVEGRVFTQSGELVAMVVQEGLARDLREGATQVPVRPT